MSFTADDHRFMARALQLAAKGLYSTNPNPRVGCVVIRDGETVGEGWHQRAGESHAEVFALREAGEMARGATAYVTLEPCCHHGRTPPCTDALLVAGVSRLVIAMEDPNPLVAGQGARKLAAAGLQVEIGLMAHEAEALNCGFVSRMRRGRPWVRCKLAVGLDGRTAMASGESQWITSDAARTDGHRWRARSSAVLTGIGTVLSDNPQLTVRLDAGEYAPPVRLPERVVLDSRLRLPLDSALANSGAGVTVITTTAEATAQALRARGVSVATVAGEEGRVALGAALAYLAERGMNEVLVEAGPTLSGELLRQGLADEVIVYMAPCVMGNEARGMFALPNVNSMGQRFALQWQDVRQVGPDIRIVARPEVRPGEADARRADGLAEQRRRVGE